MVLPSFLSLHIIRRQLPRLNFDLDEKNFEGPEGDSRLRMQIGAHIPLEPHRGNHQLALLMRALKLLQHLGEGVPSVPQRRDHIIEILSPQFQLARFLSQQLLFGFIVPSQLLQILNMDIIELPRRSLIKQNKQKKRNEMKRPIEVLKWRVLTVSGIDM